ncbi:hypothetical protein BSL78_08320 [Apostichopus japonicus]|uniref:RanBD1 domain-containing protein n=1 Tax=Stichopus japonicus TaxID=307972 RepID=A0A2G8L3I9_STIJA|nr:hypothetical protein BSL78_08320 [Apostichopus japonicus]
MQKREENYIFVRFKESDTASRFQEEFQKAQSPEKRHEEITKGKKKTEKGGEEDASSIGSRESGGRRLSFTSRGSGSSKDTRRDSSSTVSSVLEEEGSKQEKKDPNRLTEKDTKVDDAAKHEDKKGLSSLIHLGKGFFSTPKKKVQEKGNDDKTELAGTEPKTKQIPESKDTIASAASAEKIKFDQGAEIFQEKGNDWNKLCTGNIVILLDEKQKYEINMIDKENNTIIASHPVRKETQLVPAKGTDRCYVWTTEALLGDAKKEKKTTFFVRFKDSNTASLFQEEFQKAQSPEKQHEEMVKADEEAPKLAVEISARRLAEEITARRLAEEEARRLAEEKARRLAEEEAARQLAEERARQLAAEKARQLAEEEARRLAEEEAKQLAEERARQLAAEEARRLAEEEARQLAKEEARRLAEEEARRLAEEEARRLTEEEAPKLAEEEAPKLAEEEAPKLAEEEAAKLAEEEARRIAEEEARRLAEEEARRLAEEEAAKEDVIFIADVELFYEENQNWVKKGKGPIKILISKEDKTYKVEMKEGDKFIVKHPVRKETQLVPAKGTNHCYVWTTEDSSLGGKPKKTTFFARFKEAADANKFQESFQQGQVSTKKETPGKVKQKKEKKKKDKT